MASLDRGTIEAARNLGAGRLRVLVEIVVPQVTGPLVVASVLTFVTMMSVLSVPLMINAGSPDHDHRRHGLPHHLAATTTASPTRSA